MFHEFLFYTLTDCLAVFSALRAYVLSARAWVVALPVFLLSVAPAVLNYVSHPNSTYHLN